MFIYREAREYSSACRHYHKSIAIAPVLWSNVKNFCDLGGEGINPALHGYDIVTSASSSEEILCPKIEGQGLIEIKKECSLKSPSRLTKRRAGRMSLNDSSGRYMTRNKVKATSNKRSGLRTPDKNKLLLEDTKVNMMNLRRHGTPLSSVNISGISPMIISRDDDSESEQMDVENHEPRERKPLIEIDPDIVQNDYDYVYGMILMVIGM